MTNRRKFIKLSALASVALGLKPLQSFATEHPEIKPKKKTVNKPIVLSTWRFGIPANEAAWEVLKNNGRALDAVEKGVHVPEGDPNERSVGYGGRPDRDGRVTLDACIMDEFSNIGAVACLEHIKHPISVARAVMEKTPHVLLAVEGAEELKNQREVKEHNEKIMALIAAKEENELKELSIEELKARLKQ